MNVSSPLEIAKLAVEAGVTKANLSLKKMIIFGFLAGVYVGFGALLMIRVSGNLPHEWGSFGTFIGCATFPLALILIFIAGGELVTGNMMLLPFAWFQKKITFVQLLRNWSVVLVGNFLGACFVAYMFGHVVGLTETGSFLTKTVTLAQGKIHDGFLKAFVSAIGCNWFVCLAVWMGLATKDFTGKMFAAWWPVMGFATIGFQHVVANMFVITAAIFAGHVTWAEYAPNFLAVLLGNIVGGTFFVCVLYYKAFQKELNMSEDKKIRKIA
jgi:formate/nitrite transporter